MRTITITFYTFILFLLCNSANAQLEKFKTGYIISLEGDTLNGSVKLTDYPRYIKFRDEKNKTKKYTPHKIKGFKQEDVVCKSFFIDNNRYFCLEILHGELSLYKYDRKVDGAALMMGLVGGLLNSNTIDYFLVKKEGNIIEILDKKNVEKQLSNLINDTGFVENEIADKKFKSLNDIVDLIAKYNYWYQMRNNSFME